MAAHAALRSSPRRAALHAQKHAELAELRGYVDQRRRWQYREQMNPWQANVLRDLTGNPYRLCAPATFEHTTTLHGLALRIYVDRDNSVFPILADALEDAGCTDRTILDHCRGPGPHVRGCWVVDLILGKT
jgi:hypothetical protein